MKTLGGNRFVVRGHMPTEAGGCLLSVDLSQALDRVNRIKLDEVLQAHQVDADIRSALAKIIGDELGNREGWSFLSKMTTLLYHLIHCLSSCLAGVSK